MLLPHRLYFIFDEANFKPAKNNEMVLILRQMATFPHFHTRESHLKKYNYLKKRPSRLFLEK